MPGVTTGATVWHKLIVGAFVAIVLLSVVFAFLVSQRGIQLSTDLQSISPHYAPEPEVETAINRLGGDLQQELTLVVKSRSRETLENILFEFPDSIVDLNLQFVNFVNPETRLEQLLSQLEKYRFYLLTPEQQQWLEQADDQQVLQQAERNLFSLASNARLLAFNQDPFGIVNAYALNLLDTLPGSGREEIIARLENTEEWYYAPLHFRLAVNAQDFNRQSALQAEIASIETTLGEITPDIEILHSGVFFYSASAASNAKHDITLITTGSSIGILVLLLLVFRRITTLLLPVISILIGVAFAFLSCQLLFGEIHIFTIVFGASLIGVVIDYALHYAYHRQHRQQQQQDHEDQRNNLYRALFLSLITSVIGYSALSFSGLLVLQQVAVFSTVGLISAWLTVIALGSVLLRGDKTLHDAGLKILLAKILKILGHLPGKVVAGLYTLIVGLGLFITYTFSNFSDSPRTFFEPDPQLIMQGQELQTVLTSVEPATYLVIRGDSETAVYDQLASLQEQHPDQAAYLFGAQDFLAAPAARQHAYALNARLYQADGLAAQFLRGLDAAPEVSTRLTQEYTDAAGQMPNASALLNGNVLPTPPLWQIIDGKHYSFFLLSQQIDFDILAQFADRNSNVFFIDTIGMSTNAIAALRESANLLLVLALVFVGALMLLRYRSIKGVSIMAVPCAAIIFTLTLFALTGVALSLFHIMALFLVLGLGMDYVIFITDLRQQQQHTLCAVLLSAITSLLAFGLLSFSALPVVKAFGLTVLIGNTINLLGALVLARFLMPSTQEQIV